MVVGATGFIGGRLAQAFFAAGHDVICASRSRSAKLPSWCQRHVPLDYNAMPDTGTLVAALTGVDVVVNAVGILRGTPEQTFESLHVSGPRALFEACATAGVRRVIQISALGADGNAPAHYHRSKHEADRYLMGLAVDWAIVQPSLVYGAGGTSAQLFDTLASMPLIPLPGGGRQRVQPVHIDDLVNAVIKLAESPASLRCILPLVGPWPLTLKDFLCQLRGSLGLPPAPTLAVPSPLVSLGARVGDLLPNALLNRESLGMLERGNVGDSEPLAKLLGHRPMAVDRFVLEGRREARRVSAFLTWLLPLLRLGVAAMWLIAGIVSAGLYPTQASEALLRSIGIPASLAPALLWIAVAIDLLLGLLTLLPRRPRWLWSAQILVVLGYTAILTWRLPALWLEPFGPVAKNLPILALLVLLRQLDTRR
jgi:uncharacterized protein YbjT (DUF2867 family)/uncharacterized membrane protein YphA (DoxX/SURF4 family)